MRHHTGQIEVICGSMFCGKTEELIRRVRRAVIAKQQVQVFKPSLDNRYTVQHINSHNGQQIEAETLDRIENLWSKLKKETNVVAIDEVQFFGDEIVSIVERLANCGTRVILAGLDLDFRAEPFGPMPKLMCIAEEVTKLYAICVQCGESASRTQRLVDGKPARYDDPIILIGAKETYEARCRKHHIIEK